MKKKTIFNRIIFGIKSGWELPTLPSHVISFDRLILVRLFKFIGSFSTFFIISGIGHTFNNIVFYSAIFWSFSYIMYRFVLIFYTFKQWLVHLKNGDFIVRNFQL